MLTLTNAFSINMLCNTVQNWRLDVRQINRDEAVEKLTKEGYVSAIGHADTAAIVGQLLGLHVPENRATVELIPGDGIIVAQYHGPRLPEGAKTLPEQARIEFWYIATL